MAQTDWENAVKPVEKMAARLLARHDLSPPYNLDDLAKEYGTIEYIPIPIGADGITIGIGGEEKPHIIINNSAPDTRKKFTLAHELGHIIIPWHTGTIVSHIDHLEANFEYKEMEAEANAFAAELLIPKAWLLDIQNNFHGIESLINFVLESTGASRDAALIKIFNTIYFSVICAQIDGTGNIIRSYRSRSAPTSAIIKGRNVYSESIFSTEASEEYFDLGDRSYKAWIFGNNDIEETDPRSWREVLSQVLEETDSKNMLPSINAILPAQYNAHKDKAESEICSLVFRAYDGRGKFDEVIAHPLFSQYVIKRVRELAAKGNN